MKKVIVFLLMFLLIGCTIQPPQTPVEQDTIKEDVEVTEDETVQQEVVDDQEEIIEQEPETIQVEMTEAMIETKIQEISINEDGPIQFVGKEDDWIYFVVQHPVDQENEISSASKLYRMDDESFEYELHKEFAGETSVLDIKEEEDILYAIVYSENDQGGNIQVLMNPFSENETVIDDFSLISSGTNRLYELDDELHYYKNTESGFDLVQINGNTVRSFSGQTRPYLDFYQDDDIHIFVQNNHLYAYRNHQWIEMEIPSEYSMVFPFVDKVLIREKDQYYWANLRTQKIENIGALENVDFFTVDYLDDDELISIGEDRNLYYIEVDDDTYNFKVKQISEIDKPVSLFRIDDDEVIVTTESGRFYHVEIDD